MVGGHVPVFAGTVITSGLPSSTAIINISGTQDGAHNYNGDQSLWYSPFNTQGSLLEYSVQPGTYTFRIVDPTDAQKLFPALSPSQTNQIYTAWTYNSPWTEDYMVFDSAAATNSSIPQLFDSGGIPSAGSAQAAYDYTVANNATTLLRVGPLGRDSTIFTNTYTFSSAATLIFIVPDYDLGDNNGGVSVVVSPAILAPTLYLTEASGTVTLEWATNAPGFTLAQTTNLLPAAWQDVPILRGFAGTNFSVTLPLDAATSRFFRLHEP